MTSHTFRRITVFLLLTFIISFFKMSPVAACPAFSGVRFFQNSSISAPPINSGRDFFSLLTYVLGYEITKRNFLRQAGVGSALKRSRILRGMETLPVWIGESPGEITIKDDGRQMPTGAGSYEWWYADFILDNGTRIAGGLYTKPQTAIMSDAAPFVRFDVVLTDGTAYEVVYYPKEGDDVYFGEDICDVKIGPNTMYSSDMKHYSIEISGVDTHTGVNVSFSFELERTVPAWRHGDGKWYFGEDDSEAIFGWTPFVPEGLAVGILTINGTSESHLGTGYHDHNWGNFDFSLFGLKGWHWSRMKVGENVIMAIELDCTKMFADTKLPLFMISNPSDGVIFDSTAEGAYFNLDRTQLEVHPVSGKEVHRDLYYTCVMPDGETAELQISFLSDLLAGDLLQAADDIQRWFAESYLGMNPWYYRFYSESTLYLNGENKGSDVLMNEFMDLSYPADIDGDGLPLLQ